MKYEGEVSPEYMSRQRCSRYNAYHVHEFFGSSPCKLRYKFCMNRTERISFIFASARHNACYVHEFFGSVPCKLRYKFCMNDSERISSFFKRTKSTDGRSQVFPS